MRIPPEGLVIRHPERGIRNVNVLSLIMTVYMPSKTTKKHIGNVRVIISKFEQFSFVNPILLMFFFAV